MTWIATDYASLLWWLDMTGTYVFGLSGGMLAVRRQLDLFGVIVLATAAATAGGVIRDMAIGDQPAAMLRDPSYLLVTLLAGLTAFFFHRLIECASKPVMLLDALGLGTFTVAGTQKALIFGLHPAAACVIGVLTAVGGGVIRDLLVTEIPRVLREEIYAVAAIIGAGLVILGDHLGWSPLLTTSIALLATFFIRVLSVRLNLRIPRAP
ncbi:trimeric intracellular cation channel family protein [Xinfangfangia sp. D13-10-4-6]|uniref:trimeric intracellular cation channel family protein n=1 Tax=Pseudogemmobacter hezensis TaxID=2737662 RepID=UPI001556ED24|nr:trimeric intracellular cation channel family protein [Pseudogemmobacter hezensis]NPD14075.1 trimeric intracellular cation channel family protein [Pseudogemmobacter hezensis]